MANLLGALGNAGNALRAYQQALEVVQNNVTNANTPGYAARDMKPMDFENMLTGQNSETSLMLTNARHISIHATSQPFEDEEATGEGGKPTGNVVSVEQEMIKLSDTQIQYQTATNLYQKAVNMFRTAVGGRSG